MACENCENLRHSYDGAPTVPKGGRCNDILHICLNDGERWWQFNTYYHLWKNVTDPREWQVLQEDVRNPDPDLLDY